ncbi:MAG: L-rhamnose mutarotase [Sphaerochaetaceae bacterium]|jgi:L-rhamnose mutarotase|nr:L-rhamnose mutarotase [Sphaerochaetaceae bacterium]MDX9939552.1 L-rhamnose mutarotase [Sphaerochaetaceae bacterium]
MEGQRQAFVMKLKPGCEAEYEKRHREIWPELKQLLSESGVYDYSIYLDRETNRLFAFQKTRGSGGSQSLGETEIVKRWWAYMAPLMETNDDLSPVSVELREVFHMD